MNGWQRIHYPEKWRAILYTYRNKAHTFNIIPVTNLIGCAGERSWWLSLPFSPLFTEPSCVKCHQFCSSGHLIPKIMTHDTYRSHITALFKPGYVNVNLSWYGHRKQHRSTENPTETRRMEGPSVSTKEQSHWIRCIAGRQVPTWSKFCEKYQLPKERHHDSPKRTKLGSLGLKVGSIESPVSTEGSNRRQNLLDLLVLNVGNFREWSIITTNNNPSNPQQPIHSLLSTSKSSKIKQVVGKIPSACGSKFACGKNSQFKTSPSKCKKTWSDHQNFSRQPKQSNRICAKKANWN